MVIEIPYSPCSERNMSKECLTVHKHAGGMCLIYLEHIPETYNKKGASVTQI